MTFRTKRWNPLDSPDLPMKWRHPQIAVVTIDLLTPTDWAKSARAFDTMCSWRWPSKAAERAGDLNDLVPTDHRFIVPTRAPGKIDWLLDLMGEYWPGDSPTMLAVEANGGKLPTTITILEWPQ